MSGVTVTTAESTDLISVTEIKRQLRIATSDSTPKPQELASGISTALFTTLVGLAIAIPAISAYNIMRNRISRLVLEVGIISEGLMGRFQSVGKKKPAATQQ